MGATLPHGHGSLGDTILGLGIPLAAPEIEALDWVLWPRDLSRPPGGPRNHWFPISTPVSVAGFNTRFKDPIQETFPDTDSENAFQLPVSIP
jgi:hypothetical protein